MKTPTEKQLRVLKNILQEAGSAGNEAYVKDVGELTTSVGKSLMDNGWIWIEGGVFSTGSSWMDYLTVSLTEEGESLATGTGLGDTEDEHKERERAVRFLGSLKVGDPIEVGKFTGKNKFTVWRTYGVTVFITKGAGKKLYKLHTSSLSPFTLDIVEVWGGSGDPKGLPPLARFAP